MALASCEDIIEEARSGRIFILADDAKRENEGDFVCPAQFATPDVITFMITHGRGLVCLALEETRVRALDLPLMPKRGDSRFGTAFTVSIEAREGVTTGISSFDRAHTIATAIDPAKGPSDLVTPGHIFPLVARAGGVLTRAGHTEAGVDIARLAGLVPAAVICEILNDDGSMARLPELEVLAARHGLKLGLVEDLRAYRLKNCL